MKENHILVTYGGIFVIVLIVKKKKLLNKFIQEGRQQILKERYEAGDPEVDLLGKPSGKFDYYVLYPRTRKQKTPPSPPCAENHDQNWKPPLIPYYEKVLPQIPKYQTSPTSKTQTQKPLPCYMFDHVSTSYSQNFPPLKVLNQHKTCLENQKSCWNQSKLNQKTGLFGRSSFKLASSK